VVAAFTDRMTKEICGANGELTSVEARRAFEREVNRENYCGKTLQSLSWSSARAT